MTYETTSFTRRAFLQKGLTIVSATASVPYFLQRSAFGMTNPFDVALTSSIAGVPQDHVLVVVQLGGGNDGLNTVIPYGADDYYRARPSLGIPARNTLPLTDGFGLHPNLTGIKELYDEGVFGLVHGVGYPNPNRSHFTSMDIWQSADPKNPSGNGWLGRYFDNTCNGTPEPNAGIALGQEAPKAMMGDLNQPVSFESADLFRWIGEDGEKGLADPYEEITRAGTSAGVDQDSQLGFLTRTSLDAQLASDQIRAAVRQQPLVPYPRNRLGQQLKMVGAMIRAELPTRVYYVHLGGFDTHAGQLGSHANLMTRLGSSLLAFHNDLKAQGNDGRVLTMTFSEFGRRVGQNASGGTDHGTAAPTFLMGPMVKPGLHGTHPSLTDLDQGDLKYNVDFRTIYAAILENWMGTDSEPILKDKFRIAPVLKS